MFLFSDGRLSKVVKHSVHAPSFSARGGGGLTSYLIFQKWGVDRTSIFRGRVAGKEGVTFFSDVAIFT